MKKASKKLYILTVIFMATFFSCVSDQDFSVPNSLGNEENEKLTALQSALSTGEIQEISITNLKSLFIAGETVKITSPIVVKGYVSSSDRSGNFFREMFIQDRSENPTDAIKVALDLNDYYNKFNFGREVYILLNDLYLGEVRTGDGVISIGGRVNEEGNAIQNLNVNQIQDQVLRSASTEQIVPLALNVLAFSADYIGRYVQINNAHFPDDLVGKTFVDPNDTFDTKRTIYSCQGFSEIPTTIEISTFADFSFAIIPSGGGSISGVVNNTFNGDQTVLVLNALEDILFTGEKCIPNEREGFNLIFDEDFEGTSRKIDIPGWTNYSEKGAEFWESYTDANSESQAARIGSYRSGDLENVNWLITPGIDISNFSEAFLSFETSNSFADQSILELFISSDWDGNENTITTATWHSLPAKIVNNADDFRKWIYSGDIDISEFTNTVHIAFRYQGTGETQSDGTYELDNIFIHAK